MKNHLFIYFLFCRLGGTICNFSSWSVGCNSELILSVFTSPPSQATLIVTDIEPDPLERLQRRLLLIQTWRQHSKICLEGRFISGLME